MSILLLKKVFDLIFKYYKYKNNEWYNNHSLSHYGCITIVTPKASSTVNTAITERIAYNKIHCAFSLFIIVYLSLFDDTIISPTDFIFFKYTFL